MFFSHTVMRRWETSRGEDGHTHTHTHTYADMDTLLFRLPARPSLSLSLSPFLACHPDTFFCHLYFFPKDSFFYSLVYDPQQKTLLADKGEIRVGNKYQADITDLMKEGTSHVDSNLGRFFLFLLIFFY